MNTEELLRKCDALPFKIAFQRVQDCITDNADGTRTIDLKKLVAMSPKFVIHK